MKLVTEITKFTTTAQNIRIKPLFPEYHPIPDHNISTTVLKAFNVVIFLQMWDEEMFNFECLKVLVVFFWELGTSEFIPVLLLIIFQRIGISRLLLLLTPEELIINKRKWYVSRSQQCTNFLFLFLQTPAHWIPTLYAHTRQSNISKSLPQKKHYFFQIVALSYLI